jgi:hypothetical protein
MVKRILAASVVLACAALPLHAQAPAPAPAADVTVTGQVIDLNCFSTHGAQGAGHKECAVACAKAGVPLAILGTDGTVYLPVSGKPGDPQNSKLLDHAEGKVTVTGSTHFDHGLHTIEIKTVTAAT